MKPGPYLVVTVLRGHIVFAHRVHGATLEIEWVPQPGEATWFEVRGVAEAFRAQERADAVVTLKLWDAFRAAVGGGG